MATPFSENQQSILDEFEPDNLSHKSWKSKLVIVSIRVLVLLLKAPSRPDLKGNVVVNIQIVASRRRQLKQRGERWHLPLQYFTDEIVCFQLHKKER
jgi:hypothetical protein